MNGMRDMLVLCYWLDNSKKNMLEASLSDQRKLPKEKADILRELKEEENRCEGPGNIRAKR